MSDLVRNPEDRVFHDAAHIASVADQSGVSYLVVNPEKMFLATGPLAQTVIIRFLYIAYL